MVPAPELHQHRRKPFQAPSKTAQAGKGGEIDMGRGGRRPGIEISTSVISSRLRSCLPQHFSQVSIFLSPTSASSALPPHLFFNINFPFFPSMHFALPVLLAPLDASFVLSDVISSIIVIGWLQPHATEHRARFTAIAICSTDTVLQHQATKKRSG